MAIKTYTYEQACANIKKVEAKAKSIQSMIHASAIAMLNHWMKTPDAGQEVVENLNALQAASPYHTRAFSIWMGATIDVVSKDGEITPTRLVPVEWSEENKAWYVHKDTKITGKQFIAARDNPFWDVSPPPEAKPLDDLAALEVLMKKVAKHQEKPVEGDVIHLEMWKEIKTAIGKAKMAA